MTHATQRKRTTPAKGAGHKKCGCGCCTGAVRRKEQGTHTSGSGGAQLAGGPVHRLGAQAKLTVGQVGDPYEREADKVAERVASGQPAGDVSRIPAGGLGAQRQEEPPAKESAGAETAQMLAQREADAGEDEGAPTNAQAQRKSDENSKEETQGKSDEGTKEDTQRKSEKEDTTAQRGEEEKTQRQEDDENAERKADDDKAQSKEESDTPDAQAQREEEGGEDTEAQAKCACEQQEKAQRQEDDENSERKAEDDKAQRQEESDTPDAQAQRDEESGEDTEAQAQRKEEGGTPEVQAQRQADEGAAPAAEEQAGEDAQAAGGGASDPEMGQECEPPEGGESEGAEEEGGETEPAGEQLGCGEGEGEGAGAGGEEGHAPAGQSCGATDDTAGGGEGEGAGGGPDTQPSEEADPDPGAGAPVPGCAAPVEAAGAAGNESRTETAPTTGEGGGQPQAQSECGTAQRKADNRRERLDTTTASRLIHTRGSGEPLKPNVKHRLEASLGVDVNGVRVHSDGNAQAAARALRARAFTHRNHIFLGAGQSQHDLNLMAHEGTHVLQQDGIARRKTAEGERGAAPAPGPAAVTSPASSPTAAPSPAAPVLASGGSAKVVEPAGAAPAAPSSEPTLGATAPPRGGAQPPSGALPPAAPSPGAPSVGAAGAPLSAPQPAGIVASPTATAPAGAAAKAPALTSPGTAAAPSGAAPMAAAPAAPTAAAMPARQPAAPPSAPGGVSGADVAPAGAPTTSRSIAPPDPSAFTGEPSDSLAALAALSPVRAPFAFRMFSDGVDGSLKRRRASEHRNVPQGRYQARSPDLPDGRPERPPVGTGPTPTTGAVAPALAATPDKVTVASENAGPAPIVDTATGEREVDAVDEKKPGAAEILREFIRRFFASMPTSDSNVNTDPGPVPTVTYDKDSDPAQIRTIEDENQAKVTHGMEEADEERDDDFGEHEIEPELEDGEEKIPVPAHVHEMGTGCDPEAKAEPLNFDAPHEAELAERVHKETGSRWTAETDRLDASEKERDLKISGERAALPGRIAVAHTNAYRQEDEAAEAARTEVNRLRESWGTENRGVQTRFADQTTCEATGARGAIAGHVGQEEGLIAARHQTDKAAAEAEKKRVEENARKEKEEAERKAKSESSGGLISRGLGWLKNKARSALAWVAKKVKGWFDDLRAWVRKKFDEFKAWVNEKIEAARRWINEKLEGLRRRFHALVDKYLGEYPEIAARFHKAIDTTIDGAQAAVNRAADRLKKTVNALIDGLAKAVDVALAVTEKVVVGALTVACDIVVIGSNLVVAFVEGDLESMITLVRELPDWPPLFGGLMSVVRAGFLGFLERMHAKPADEKKRFVEKLRGLLTSGKYYGGVFLGILNGLIVEGLFGTIKMIWDIITGIPEIITNIYNAIKRLASDVEAIAAIADRFRATAAEVKAFLDRPDSAEQLIAMFKRAPQILVAMIDKALHEGREWAYRAGAKAADALFNWILTASNFDIGLAVGTFIGQVIFEVLLLVFTAGAGTAVKWGGKALQWLLKGLRMLTGGLRKGGGLIMKGITLVREIVVAGLTAARKLGGTIKKVLAKIGDLVDSVFDWFRRAFGKVGRKLGRKVSPQERARWARFRLEVKEALVGHPDGLSKGAVQGIYRGILTRYRDVVGWPTVITKSDAHWRLWARPKKGLRPRPVGRVLMDHATRWKQGKKAVAAAIRSLKRRVENIDVGRIDTALAPVKRDFRYTVLQTHFDERENEFIVEGAMSARRKVSKTAPKRPTDNKVTVKDASEHIRVNPLVKKRPLRSAPSGDPPGWTEVQKIKTFRGRTSLYRQGHLVSGYFLEGDAWNLTPITFSANSLMATRAETPVRGKLPLRATESSSKPVFTYDVSALGTAGTKPPLRKRAFMKDGDRVCETIPAESRLHKTITISIDAYGYNPASHKWNRPVALPKGAKATQNIPNVPPFPIGQPCPTPKKKKKGKST